MEKLKIFRTYLMLSFALVATIAVAHDGGHHKKMHPSSDEVTSLEKINQQYLNDIKPVFQKKCFDCHSSQTRMPWYSKVPGVQQLIAHDIEEAKEHIDMERDFPFSGHSSPLEDLLAIDKSVQADEMPPFLYRVMHTDSKLTIEEKKNVHDWVQSGHILLASPGL